MKYLMSCLVFNVQVRAPQRIHSKARLAGATDMNIYFCDPQRPWQHGSNEITNGLLRGSFRRVQISWCTRRQNSMRLPGN
jgi:hypothetical protein